MQGNRRPAIVPTDLGIGVADGARRAGQDWAGLASTPTCCCLKRVPSVTCCRVYSVLVVSGEDLGLPHDALFYNDNEGLVTALALGSDGPTEVM